MAKCLHDRERSRCTLCGDLEQIFNGYQRQAQARGLRFELNFEQFRQIIFQPCYYCNEYGQPRGLDRRDNTRGYEVRNVQACCWPCNRLKGALGEYEFLGLVLKIARHQEKLKKAKLEQKLEPEVAAQLPGKQNTRPGIAPRPSI